MMMHFAIFDQMERLDTPLHQLYRDRLALLEAADQAGFWCYFKSEHHMTPLDTAPSIRTWLAAVAARTTRIRVGSMVHLLPFYHPIRLLEEIAMLDHLSGGRLELGVGRGISPREHDLWGLEPELARDRSEEVLEIILAGMTAHTLDYEGKFWHFEGIPLEVSPLQKPHPPLWYPGNIEFAGRRGFHTLTAGSVERVTETVTRFRELNGKHGGDPDRVNGAHPGRIGLNLRVLVTEDERQALKRARESWQCFDRNLMTLWRQAGITELPGNPTADGDFDKALVLGTAFAGTPAMLLERLEGYHSVGIDLLVLCFDWGNLSATETRRSLDLVAEHIIPTLAFDDSTAAS
jgi:alkanesulfonate monooxygenase SsuD/methylene tetrahydromethanopterin reductase-like flavin-dependent oxidoreductase (luciferase family)